MQVTGVRTRLYAFTAGRALGASVPKVKAYASGIDLNLTDAEISAFYSGLAAKGVKASKLQVGIDEERLAQLEVEQLTPGIALGSWGRRLGAGLFNVSPEEQDDLH